LILYIYESGPLGCQFRDLRTRLVLFS